MVFSGFKQKFITIYIGNILLIKKIIADTAINDISFKIIFLGEWDPLKTRPYYPR